MTAALGLALASCTNGLLAAGGSNGVGPGNGNGSGGTGAGASAGASGTGVAGAGGVVVPPPPPGFTPQSAGLRRLTLPQYANSIHDLLGAKINVPTDFEPDTALSGFASIGAARVSFSAHIVEQFETAALDISKQALTDMTGRAALIGCTPSGATDEVCTKQFIQKIGRRAWRRALTDAEVTSYAGVAKNAQTVVNDFYGGLQYALAGIIQSPHFLYREELGSPDPSDATRVVFDDHELATRLSYFLLNSTPDDQLLDAADGHALTQAGGLVSQATRLLASDRLPVAMQSFFTELYRLGELDGLLQLSSVYPLMSPTLGASFREETLEFLNDIAFTRNADFREIFDGRSTFVNAELAKVYGLTAPAGTGFSAIMLPDSGMRAGLLGQGSFLALNSQPNRSSATRRGKYIRNMLLCQDIPAPPPNVPAFPEAIDGTARVKLTAHRADPACSSCHALMDPIGLGLENFDGIGAFRTMDSGQPIDASGDLDGAKFQDARGLAEAIKNHPNAPTCIARNVYRYAVAHVDNTGEQGAVQDISAGFQGAGFQFRALLAAVVKSPGFVYAAKAN